MIKFAIKAAIAGTAVYYIKEQGIFNKSDESIESYRKLKQAVSPYIQDVTSQIPIELPEIPPTDNVSQLATEYWNRGVRASFAFLVRLPECSKHYIKKGVDQVLENPEVKKFVDSFSSTESKVPPPQLVSGSSPPAASKK
ncbi:MICOS complex subunit MIC13 homolog QIL1 isoform X2 [Sitophilus oryzae]|uniref:MICOS complex subunit MIC13 n=1 Tax=Sitophilus oryzae TaxID=7048 RepID=A0A6J2Y1C0_SITOR|nr:MICOS complex subunit MIC13 homolog QIL1 isoform X2 [Sitophilus oryzae]